MRRGSLAYEVAISRELLQELDVDRWWFLGEYLATQVRDPNSPTKWVLKQPRRFQMRLCPPHPVAEEALLPAGKQFLPLPVRQMERFSHQVGHLPHGPLLPIAKDLDQGEHHGLKIGDRHGLDPSYRLTQSGFAAII